MVVGVTQRNVCARFNGDNINSKLKQGCLSLLQSYKEIFFAIGNVNKVARVKASVKRNIKCEHQNRKHVEYQPAMMKKDEQDLQHCMKEFSSEPFDTS